MSYAVGTIRQHRRAYQLWVELMAMPLAEATAADISDYGAKIAARPRSRHSRYIYISAIRTVQTVGVYWEADS